MRCSIATSILFFIIIIVVVSIGIMVPIVGILVHRKVIEDEKRIVAIVIVVVFMGTRTRHIRGHGGPHWGCIMGHRGCCRAVCAGRGVDEAWGRADGGWLRQWLFLVIFHFGVVVVVVMMTVVMLWWWSWSLAVIVVVDVVTGGDGCGGGGDGGEWDGRVMAETAAESQYINKP
jgi:hypothetical protein